MSRLALACGMVLSLVVACAPAAEQTRTAPSAPRRGADSGFVTPADRATLLALTEEAIHTIATAPDGSALIGRNPNHALQIRFEPTGVQVISLRPASPWQLGLHLVSYGRADNQTPVEPTQPVTSGRTTVQYHRSNLVEAYLNDRRGLEQTFTLTAPPSGPRQDGPVRLVVDAAGLGNTQVEPDERGVTWTDGAGEPVARYSQLVAWDSEGQAVPARLLAQGWTLWLEVDDTAAAYPLTIDPLVQQANLTADDGAAGDQFGGSVALSWDGNTAVVGATLDDVGGNEDQGSAYVFTRSGATWTQQARLAASDGSANDHLGTSVALSSDGGMALVGARDDDVGGNADQGSAYVFVRSGTTWSQQAHLTADDGAAGDGLGASVALSPDGGNALVGAPGDDVGGNADQGSAYVFVRSVVTWSQRTHLTAADGTAGATFGASVALSGDGGTAVVGAPRFGPGTLLCGFPGRAHVFAQSGGNWSEQAHVDGVSQEFLGASVALSADGGTALVGASGRQNSRFCFAPVDGSARVLVRSGSTWSQQAILSVSDNIAFAKIVSSVALSADGGTALVANDSTSRVFVFARSGSAWGEVARLTNAAEFCCTGTVAISADGSTALVGEPGNDVGGKNNQGSAFVFGPFANTACSPRPNIVLQTGRIGPGQLRGTLTAPQTALLTNNALQSIQVARLDNATITVNGASTTAGQTVTLPAGTTSAQVVVVRAAPGAFMARLAVTDGCGARPTFLGGGAATP